MVTLLCDIQQSLFKRERAKKCIKKIKTFFNLFVPIDFFLNKFPGIVESSPDFRLQVHFIMGRKTPYRG